MTGKKEIKINPDGLSEEVVWKDIDDYEGFYQVNQFGQVKSLEREVSCGGGVRMTSERLRKLTVWVKKSDKGDVKRYFVNLSAYGKVRTYLVHRLVAEAFLGIPRCDPETSVKFADNDYRNIYVKNLVPISTAHSRAVLMEKPVECENAAGKRHTFRSRKEAAKKFGVAHSRIGVWISGGKYYRGWKWSELNHLMGKSNARNE